MLEPGTTNQRLDDFLSQNDTEGSFLIPPLQEKDCALCTITDYPFNTDENIFRETEDYFIVECAYKKGHETRNMVVFKDHSSWPSEEDLADMGAEEAFQGLLDYSDTGDGKERVVYGSMNTFNHPHFICSDLEPEGSEAKLSDINNFLVFEDPYELDTVTDERYGDEVGEKFLKRFYNAATSL